jgi:hypothetical protein
MSAADLPSCLWSGIGGPVPPGVVWSPPARSGCGRCAPEAVAFVSAVAVFTVSVVLIAEHWTALRHRVRVRIGVSLPFWLGCGGGHVVGRGLRDV